MKGARILIEPRPDGGAAAALIVGGRLDDLLIDPPADDAAPRPEALYRAVVERPLKGTGGAVVALGDGLSGFLRGAAPAPGSSLIVEVATWAEAGKAAPVSARPVLRGRFAILTPGARGANLARAIPEGPRRAALAALAAEVAEAEGPGLILRSRAADVDPEVARVEIAALRARWRAIEAAASAGPAGLLAPAPGAAALALRDWPDAPAETGPEALADAGVWEEVAALLRQIVPLGAGSMAIEPTRALVAVDVNTGGDLSPAAGLKANLAAARELPRQLRLRGLGGQIALDLAPLAKRDRPKLEAALRAALGGDGIETTIAGWTPLGNLELLRKRARRPLAELPRR